MAAFGENPDIASANVLAQSALLHTECLELDDHIPKPLCVRLTMTTIDNADRNDEQTATALLA